MSADWDAPQRSLADRVSLGAARLSTTIVALAFVGVLGGCGSTDAPPAPAAPETALRNVEVIAGTDKWGARYNITTGCFEGNRLFLRADNVAATLDPTCTEAVAR